MILKVAVLLLALLAVPLIALFGLVAVAGSAAGVSGAAAGQATFNPSEEALDDIPEALLPLYIDAAAACPGLPWQVIAGIAKVESNHGRVFGGTVAPDGRILPPIIGIALNGENGTLAIADTDNGILDGDTVWDRAVGPFQFIPSSWAIFAQDGNRDGIRDPHNFYDALPAAIAHLCPNGVVTDVAEAIFNYNHSFDYVTLVLEWAARYTGPLASNGGIIEGYAYPLPAAHAGETIATRRHHDYPAIDIGGTPVGTPAFAMVTGTVTSAIGDAGLYVPGGSTCGNTVIIAGVDGATYTYCHLSAVFVVSGQVVTAGQGVGLTGGQPGSPGAGTTTGPHLHLGIQAYGQSVCPQPVLLGIIRGTLIPPTAAPTIGCYFPGPSTDWSAWLSANYVPPPPAESSPAEVGI